MPGFVRHSYRISRCRRMPGEAEIAAHRGLLMCEALTPANFRVLLGYLEREAGPRGPDEAQFEQFLRLANAGIASADELKSLFRLLRPFTDANARCGRALWMWRTARGGAAERAALAAFGEERGERRRS